MDPKVSTEIDAATPGEAEGGAIGSLLVKLRQVPPWIRAHRVFFAAAGGATLLVVAVVAAVLLTRPEDGPPPDELLATAFRDLDAGNWRSAAEIAAKLRVDPRLSFERVPDLTYLYGMVAARRADEYFGRQRRQRHLVAATYLDDARSLGFPRDREADGHFQLGLSWFEAGKLSASRVALEAALPLCPDREAEIHALLAEAHLRDASPKLSAALAHNAAFLTSEQVDSAGRERGLIQRAQIQLLSGNLTVALATLAEIPSESTSQSEAATLRARILMREAESLAEKNPTAPPEVAQGIADKYRSAIESLRGGLERDTLQNQSASKAVYLIGVCYERLGDGAAALAQYQIVAQRFAGTSEEWAARLHIGDSLRDQGRDREALAEYRSVLEAVDFAGEFHNPWLTLETLRTRATATFDAFVERKQFASAIALAKLLGNLFSPARALQLEAEARVAWARDAIAQAAQMSGTEAAAATERGRDQFRRAARGFRQLARLRVATRDYPNDLWEAATNDLAGHDYENAIADFETYLSVELRQRRPAALVGLGEALLARDRLDDAIATLQRVGDDHPRDPATFRARLLMSAALLEKGDAKAAEAQLRKNLDDQQLTPASQEWRDALFALGQLLYRDQRYAEAIDRLEEAAARYADDARAVEAQYLVAESNGQLAAQAAARQSDEATPREQQALDQQVAAHWQAALDGYQAVVKAIDARRGGHSLSDVEAALVRNSFFGRGLALFELRRYGEAIKAYEEATNRYLHEPEALDAYVQMATCYRRLDQPLEARSALEQARIVLNQLPEDGRFAALTNYGRAEWRQFLDELSTN